LSRLTPHQKNSSFLIVIGKLWSLLTLFMKNVYFQRFRFELYGFFNVSNSVVLATWKTGFPPERRHNDVAGARDLPQKMWCCSTDPTMSSLTLKLNIDHNPSATTAKDSFHGTGISLLQHSICANGGMQRGLVITDGPAVSRTIDHLPTFYPDVPPVASTVNGSTLPPTSIISQTEQLCRT